MNNEDIKILEDLIFELKSFSLDIEGFKRAQAIENLIVKYKELEENLNFKQKELNKLYDTEEKFIDDFYIPKSKVKEKIEELEELVKDFEEYWSKDPRKFKKEKCIDYYKLEALQELLREE